MFLFINSVSEIVVTRVLSANRLLDSPVGVNVSRRDRERWALVLKKGGKTFYQQEEERILSDGTHPVILPKGCSYSWQCVEPGECIIIEFEALGEGQKILPFEVSDHRFIVNGFARLEKTAAENEPERKFLLYEMLMQLHRSVGRDYVPRDKKIILQPALDLIVDQYYDSTLSNDALAAQCGISTVYFRKTFGQIYGVSPIKYLHQYRIEKAKSILESDFDSVEQVARSVGYNSLYHFSKMFKLYTGKSPSEYAKK